MNRHARMVLPAALLALALVGCEGEAGSSPAAAAPTRCEQRQLPFSRNVDLTGAWSADGGGLYYIRQIGRQVWWVGLSGLGESADRLGRDYSNTFQGTIENDLTIRGRSVDVPRGGSRNQHDLTFKVVDLNGQAQIQLVRASGTYGDKVLRPCESS